MKVILIYILMLSALSIYSKPIVVFVHGMGGRGNFSFCEGFDDLNKEFNAEFDTIYYKWNTNNIPLEVMNGSIDKYKKSILLVESKEYLRFQKLIFDLQDRGDEYYIVGFSMGAYLVYRSLSENRSKVLSGLKGVYFMGAAYERIYNNIDRTTIPNVERIINYYSRNYDIALKMFYEVSGIEAGGRVGFDDYSLYKNYRTIVSHRLFIDYSTMMEPLLGLLMLKESKIKKIGVDKYLNKFVSKGLDNWSDIYSFKYKIYSNFYEVMIQKIKIGNMITKKYRAVIVTDYGKDNIKIAESDSIFELLGMFVDSPLYVVDGNNEIVSKSKEYIKLSYLEKLSVVFSSLKVKKRKSNGETWDFYSKDPDLFIEITVDGESFKTEVVDDKTDIDIFKRINFEGNKSSRIVIKVFDKDFSSNDEIGVYSTTVEDLKLKKHLSFGYVLNLDVDIE
ncbi:MAG: hypothetical protein CR982_06550 [Candidatus Cloacimonadota bacterium]|nr:MAG: hypothetical protein CR982_06550 [Candidatus Cloacimonadota bacterium]PIE79949.1 MAG: hypothetical protein CSA15_02470 [Candidatus Delongbacteria bacterium]